MDHCRKIQLQGVTRPASNAEKITHQRIMIKARQNYSGTMQLINVRGQNVMTKEIKILKNTIQEIEIQGKLTVGIYFERFEDRMISPTRIFVY